jgi:hypothetical protein
VPGAAASDLDRYNAATAHLEPPLAIVDLAALRENAAAMTARAGASRSGWPASPSGAGPSCGWPWACPGSAA